MKAYIYQICFGLGLLFCFNYSYAQDIEHTGWLGFNNTTTLNNRFSTHLDIQFRGSDNLDHLGSFHFRPGLTYKFNSTYSVTAGYKYVASFSKSIGGYTDRLDEHRIWQQFAIKQNLNKVRLSHRFRLEQRFIETNKANVFVQRGRYSIDATLPLVNDSVFTKGLFLSIRNEVFVNLQNKSKDNGKFFNQNRAYFGGGYRINKNTDVDISYLWKFDKRTTIDVVSHVLVLSLSTNF